MLRDVSEGVGEGEGSFTPREGWDGGKGGEGRGTGRGGGTGSGGVDRRNRREGGVEGEVGPRGRREL